MAVPKMGELNSAPLWESLKGPFSFDGNERKDLNKGEVKCWGGCQAVVLYSGLRDWKEMRATAFVLK